MRGILNQGMPAGGAAASGFALAQQKVLRKVLKSNAGSTLYAHLNMNKLAAYRDFDLLYQAYVRAAPVQSPRGWLESVAKLAPQGGPASTLPLSVLNTPNLVTRGRPLAASLYRGQPLPVDRAMIGDFLAAESRVRKVLQGQGLLGKGTFYYLNEVEPQLSVSGQLPMRGWQQLVDAERTWLNKRWAMPRIAGMPNAGNSRYQWFSAHWDQLKGLGRSVEVLVVHPKTLLDFALYISQQEGKFVPISAWCPNLRALVLTGYDMALQRVELGYLLSGLPDVKWLQWYMQPGQPGGLCAWQSDLSIRQRLVLPGEGSTFYEFIPMDDVYPDGRFVRNYRRLHGGQLVSGQEYMVVVSNTAGWLGVSTGQVVRAVGPMDAVPELKVMMMGPTVRLNGLSEGFTEASVVEALANINKALQGHGVFLRDALLGHHVTERRPMWVMEISRPLSEVPVGLLDSIARRLHGELELRHDMYRNNLRQANLRAPVVHFVPIGTFAAASPQGVDMSLFDHTPEASVVKKIVDAAWQSQAVQLGHG